jgi:hypothetical protein
MLESEVPSCDIYEPSGAFVVKCGELVEVRLFQSRGITSPLNNVQWNLKIQLLASLQIDLFVEEDVLHRHESLCSSSNSSVNFEGFVKVGHDLTSKVSK